MADKSWKDKLVEVLTAPAAVGRAAVLGSSDLLPVRAEQLGIIPPNPESPWNKHDAAYADATEQAIQTYGGWNRNSRNMKGFAGGMDYAMRNPGKQREADILAAMYQITQMPGAALSPKSTIADEYQDYQANSAGIKAAQEFLGMLPDDPMTKEKIMQRARDYAEALRNRGK